jgi:hypothetical protein
VLRVWYSVPAWAMEGDGLVIVGYEYGGIWYAPALEVQDTRS